MNKNIKFIIAALAIALWYNASQRLLDFLLPDRKNILATLSMFIVSAMILLYDDGRLGELVFDFKNSRFFNE
jgi:hypothetical protein